MDTDEIAAPASQDGTNKDKEGEEQQRPHSTNDRDRDSNDSNSHKSSSQDKPDLRTSVGPDEKTEIDEEDVKKMMDWVKSEDQPAESQNEIEGGKEVQFAEDGDNEWRGEGVDETADNDNADRDIIRTGGVPVEIDLKAMSPRVKDPGMPVINQQVAYSQASMQSGTGIVSPACSKLPSLTPGKATIARIPSPAPELREELEKMLLNRQTSIAKYPPQMMRMAKVNMSQSARVRGSERLISTAHSSQQTQRSARHYIEPPNSHRPAKVLRWDDAMNARPPLRIDMEGPSPCSYSPHLYRPLKETTAPAFTFGRRTFVEKENMGSRTSWEKTWFQSPDIWRQKTDFFSDRVWPSPMHYNRKQNSLGDKQPTNIQFPSFSFGYKRDFNDVTRNSAEQPSPGDYDPDRADIVTRKTSPSYTHSSRKSTVCWPQGADRTPGPGAYNPKEVKLHKNKPAFTIRGIRREKTHELGPFAAF